MNPELNKAICYIEFPAKDLPAIKSFYSKVFGWTFQDWGTEYISFSDGQMAGGFYQTDGLAASQPLVVIWADDLEAMAIEVESAGGEIVQPIFSFPGGRRFHFTDPNGNELSVCSK
ncbi:VOC family protein [Persicitalea jodogahamensis]|uniref:Bleomycin resistance protein n=1 Tax=Persicitalea jodogahamensis TaxID=402147 RepID=A0A8J3G9D5_9BACT|nr:VOC family protein [Persicitalea jodogahamensis]GHB62445.1 bleomycin resistance protein [Persicitalea jodogahamensis]